MAEISIAPTAASVAALKRDERLLNALRRVAEGTVPSALDSDIRAALPALIAAAEAALAPPPAEDIVAQLTHILRLIGHGMSQAEREDWIDSAELELCKLPGGLVMEGLRHAAQTCEYPRQVVKSVFDYCENYPARMQQELERLRALAEAQRRLT